MKKERIETFTDCVVAIVITLMVLSIKLPVLTPQNSLVFGRQILVYGLSFISIAIIWLNLHNMFLVIERVDTKTIWTNLFLLFFMSLIPLPTQALGGNFFAKESHLFYGEILTATSFTYAILQTIISRTLKKVSARNRIIIDLRNWLSTLLYGASIPLSFLNIYYSAAIFALIPIIYFIPSKKLHVTEYTIGTLK